jgi:GNAT superfamily N-acetyltransferase
MAQLAIRRCLPTDRDAVLALLLAQLGEHDNTTPRAEVAAGLDGMLARPERGVVLAAEHDGRVVAIAVLSSMWTLEHGGCAMWLDELYVEPALRGAGIGTRLLAAAYETARELGARTLDLEVVAGHERAAQLYLREGFARLPRTRFVRQL